jgi:hypothetical protein
LGDGEQGRRRRQKEWIGSGKEEHQEFFAQRRAQGRGFAVESVALGRRTKGRCHSAAQSQSGSRKRQRWQKPEEHGRQP